MSSLVILVILVLMVIYGWPFIEAIIILTPIPDPEDIKDSIKGMADKIKEKVSAHASGIKIPSAGGSKKDDYSSNLDQTPQNLADDDDDDENDIGARPSNSNEDKLNFDDSDEKDDDDLEDGGSQDLLSMENNKKTKKIPKKLP